MFGLDGLNTSDAIAPTVNTQAAPFGKGSRRPRDKSARTERALVRFLLARGFAAQRVLLSGAAGGGVDRRCEVKCRGRGFNQLYDWLQARDLLIVRADRRKPLVILSLALAAELAAVLAGAL